MFLHVESNIHLMHEGITKYNIQISANTTLPSFMGFFFYVCKLFRTLTLTSHFLWHAIRHTGKREKERKTN